MLNFTKFKIIFIYFIFVTLSAFAFLNIISSEKPILQKKINLGLDLQGGSYLLLEVDTRSLIEERLQDKYRQIRLLNPKYLTQFVEEFENLVRGE